LWLSAVPSYLAFVPRYREMSSGPVFRRGLAELRGRLEILSSSTEHAVVLRILGNGTVENVFGACAHVGVAADVILPRIATWALEAVAEFGDAWEVSIVSSENRNVEYTARHATYRATPGKN
jgi:hypothetical protein